MDKVNNNNPLSIVDSAINDALNKQYNAIPHHEVLGQLAANIERIDFRKEAGLEDGENLHTKHFVVLSIDNIIKTAKLHKWQIARNNGFVYLFNGAYWLAFDRNILQSFFGECAEKLGVNQIDAKHHVFRLHLEKQFDAVGYFPTPEPVDGVTLINVLNGTMELTRNAPKLRPPSAGDFLKYQLQFPYLPNATAPKWEAFLDRVQPNKEVQMVLQEFIGYVFTDLNLETVLLLYGSGANGKSVFIDVISAMLGVDNVSSYSLQSLTAIDSYSRANLANKLLNCDQEANGKMGTSILKQLASGQPVEARIIYKEPFIMTKYAKLLFACNELPKEVEQTNGFFRRWKVIPFEQTIPQHEQNINLANEIIRDELSGVFNWALEGLQRLIKNNKFTPCQAIDDQNNEFRRQSDNVAVFADDKEYKPGNIMDMPLKQMFEIYRAFCLESGFHAVSIRKFAERLRSHGFQLEKKSVGQIVYFN